MPDLLNKLLAQLKAKKVGQKPPALSPDMDDLDMKDSTMPSVAGGAGPSIGMRGPAVKAKDVKKTMRRLVEYMKRYMPLIVTALVMVSAGTVFNLIGPSKPIYIGFGSMGIKMVRRKKQKSFFPQWNKPTPEELLQPDSEVLLKSLIFPKIFIC